MHIFNWYPLNWYPAAFVMVLSFSFVISCFILKASPLVCHALLYASCLCLSSRLFSVLTCVSCVNCNNIDISDSSRWSWGFPTRAHEHSSHPKQSLVRSQSRQPALMSSIQFPFLTEWLVALMHICLSGFDIAVMCHTVRDPRNALKSYMSVQNVWTDMQIFEFLSHKIHLDVPKNLIWAE